MDERIDEFLKVVEQKVTGGMDFWVWDDLCGSLDQLCENKEQSDRLLAGYEELKRKDRIAFWDSRFMEATISGALEHEQPSNNPYIHNPYTTSVTIPHSKPTTILTTPALQDSMRKILEAGVTDAVEKAYKDDNRTSKAR